MAEEGFWTKHVTGKNGMFGRLSQDGVSKTLSQNFKWETGNTPFVFARGIVTTAGAVMAYQAIANDKTAEGEDRSMMARLTQFIIGGGVAAGALLVGKGK